jgi:amidase
MADELSGGPHLDETMGVQTMADELARLDATAQAALVRQGKISATELVDAAIRRVEQLNPQLGAVILPAFERARRRAAQITESPVSGAPFLGVPFLMKDLGGEEAGEPCHRGMAALKTIGWIEPQDSYLVTRLRQAGFVSLGRTNTPELGLLPTTEPAAYGPTRNPWNLAYSAGGSSGGSAAAVAAGLVAAAHASDGGGSIRIPAAHCGLVGLKPTRARNSFGPLIGERWGGFSCEHVVTRSVRDSAAILDVTHGQMPGDPYCAPPPARPFVAELSAQVGRLRIGLLAAAPRSDLVLHPECATAARTAARQLEGLGHIVEEAHPVGLGDPEALGAYVTIVSCNVVRALEVVAGKVGRPLVSSDVEPMTWAVAEMGRQRSAVDYVTAVELVHACGRRLASWWQSGFDLLLTPTTAQPPPRLGELVSPPDAPLQGFLRSAPYGAYTSVFNQTGQPAVSLPLHWTADGLPVGVQLVAAYGREDLLLRVASQLEAACPWSERRPSLFP